MNKEAFLKGYLNRAAKDGITKQAAMNKLANPFKDFFSTDLDSYRTNSAVGKFVHNTAMNKFNKGNAELDNRLTTNLNNAFNRANAAGVAPTNVEQSIPVPNPYHEPPILYRPVQPVMGQ